MECLVYEVRGKSCSVDRGVLILSFLSIYMFGRIHLILFFLALRPPIVTYLLLGIGITPYLEPADPHG